MTFRYIIFIAPLFFLLSGNSRAQNLQDLTFGTDTTLEVVTWNIEWFPKQDETTITYVVEIIKAIDADIYALQEIDDRNAFIQLDQELDNYQGYHVPGDYLGLAYLFKTGQVITNDIYEIFTGNSRQFPRPPLVVELVFNGKDYIVINNHFKCCGNGTINLSDPWDEETRRLDATNLLKGYIDTYFPDRSVILVGDLNDQLTDMSENNVFLPFLDEPWSYAFADMEIAQGHSSNWSYPSWPSHLDHILITNELFNDLANNGSTTMTIKVDNYLPGGFDEYEQFVSDHRPVGIKIHPAYYAGEDENKPATSRIGAYPNPFQQRTTIFFQPEGEYRTLDIYTSNGKIVRKIRVPLMSSSIVFDAAGMDEGLYFARIHYGGTQGEAIKILLVR